MGWAGDFEGFEFYGGWGRVGRWVFLGGRGVGGVALGMGGARE